MSFLDRSILTNKKWWFWTVRYSGSVLVTERSLVSLSQPLRQRCAAPGPLLQAHCRGRCTRGSGYGMVGRSLVHHRGMGPGHFLSSFYRVLRRNAEFWQMELRSQTMRHSEAQWDTSEVMYGTSESWLWCRVVVSGCGVVLSLFRETSLKHGSF